MQPEFTNEDLTYTDDGDGWKVYPPTPIDKRGIRGPIEHVSNGGAKTGIWYAIGPDQRSGETKLAWVKWPKNAWSLEDLKSSPAIPKFFSKCNVCHADNQLREMDRGVGEDENEVSEPEVESGSDYYPEEEPRVPARRGRSPSRSPGSYPTRRYSIADVMPKWGPFAIDVLKSMFLNEFGDVVSTVTIAALADIYGGTTEDEGVRAALQCFSDDQIDSLAQRCDPKYIGKVKKGVGMLYEAYKKDSKILDSMKSSMVRPIGDVMKDVGIDVKKSSQSRKGSPSTSLFNKFGGGGGIV